MGSESKEKGLWTWSMEEVSSQCSFCEVIVGGSGQQESRDWGCMWTGRGLGNERSRNPIMHGPGVLAWGAGS